ncbi:MAG: Glu-tRNA(Gln) amidotransferase subunit GatE [Candidatus Woesearchaeota archaeon]|jgi:Glu-tRNA(Gln) amidotransferase subunit E-like FAD-binding protein|nr:Glu-tRNA(Gln) amidotransferase subunit GatE [Candidatus Woesearchaeota archaeon]|tara:strand:+ start:33295 stop:34737 length:1443 start_codon:yes stop_codon:yes gene_type:complete
MPNMEVNYNELGFKCGLEIHQQLEGKKLFCNCPTINSDNDPNVKFERRLRAVAGETGEIDIAAKHEMQKKKKFIYEADSSDTCLIEYDEQPPNELNRKALETAIKVALLLNAKIADEIQVMRKTVVDGSNVSGFQRTALIAVNGFIETSQGKVTIPIICLEEEAAKKQEEGNDFVRYRLDRLSIPLIEIATGSEIKNPEHAKETASHIGMVLRSVENIKRGLGTIRQDVNTSITKGERTEIKGFQDLKSIPKVIEYEIKRQLNSIKNSKKINKEVRKAEPDLTTSFLRPMPGAARLYPETDCSPVKIKKEHIEKLKKELPKLKSERLEEFQKKHNILQDLAKELIDNPNYETYVKNFKKLNSQLIAYYLINVPKEIKKRFKLDITKLQDKDFEEVLGYLNERKINDDGAIDIFIKKIKNEKIDFDKFAAVSEKELDKEIKKIIEEKKGLSIGAYMGILMGKYRGKADGKKIMEILKKYLN